MNRDELSRAYFDGKISVDEYIEDMRAKADDVVTSVNKVWAEHDQHVWQEGFFVGIFIGVAACLMLALLIGIVILG